jgi:hypothetical protein
MLTARIWRGEATNMPSISTTITTGNTAPRPAPSSAYADRTAGQRIQTICATVSVGSRKRRDQPLRMRHEETHHAGQPESDQTSTRHRPAATPIQTK